MGMSMKIAAQPAAEAKQRGENLTPEPMPRTIGTRARMLAAALARRSRVPLALGALLLLSASTASVLATTNSPPELRNVRLSDSSPLEGQSVSVSGSVNDANPEDVHVVVLFWYGGDTQGNEAQTQQIRLAPGETVFQASHVYADNLPGSGFEVRVFDHELPPGPNDNSTDGGRRWDSEFLPLTVRNAPPAFVPDSVKATKQDKKVIVEGTLTDPGSADTISVEAAWGDPANKVPTACNMSNGSRRFRCEHTYPASWGLPRTYHIGLRAIDDDGGMANHQTSVRLP